MSPELIGELFYRAVRDLIALADQAHKGHISGAEFHAVVTKFSSELEARRKQIDAELEAKFKETP